MLGPGKLAGLLEDTLEMYNLGLELLEFKDESNIPWTATRRYKALAKIHDAAKTLAGTYLEELKEEGLMTTMIEGEHRYAPCYHCPFFYY
jgi:hypothetical protein